MFKHRCVEYLHNECATQNDSKTPTMMTGAAAACQAADLSLPLPFSSFDLHSRVLSSFFAQTPFLSAVRSHSAFSSLSLHGSFFSVSSLGFSGSSLAAPLHSRVPSSFFAHAPFLPAERSHSAFSSLSWHGSFFAVSSLGSSLVASLHSRVLSSFFAH